MRLVLLPVLVLVGCATGEPNPGHPDGRKPRSDQRVDWAWLLDGVTEPDLPLPQPEASLPFDLGLPKDLPRPPDQHAPSPDKGVKCPDSFEPNNLCSGAAAVGKVVEDAGWSGAKSGTLDSSSDVDWFAASGEEAGGTCIPFTSECLQFKVQVVVPAGRTFKVCLYKNNCNGASTCVSNLGGQTTLTTQFKVDGTCAYDDGVDARIMVQPTDGKGSCDSYSLSYRYDSC
jgi:hypothetical protein